MSNQAEQWSVRALGELCDPERGITYGIVKVGEYVPGGIPVIRGGDIRENRIVFSNEKRVTAEVSNQFKRTVLRGGEIVLNLIAEPGHCAIVPLSIAGANVSRDVAVIALGESVNHAFVNYYLRSPAAIEWLSSRLQGSVTQKINLGTLREIPVPIPPRIYQDAIAGIVSALDDKISANEQIVATCDELRTQRLVHFGASNASQVVMRPLSSLAEFVNGRAFTKDATGTGRMVIRIAEINSGPSGSTVYNDIQVDDRHLAKPGDVLFSWSGSLTVTRWFRAESIINQHIFKVIPKEGLPNWLVFEFINNALGKFRGIAAGKATTMGHIQRHHLDEPVLAPAAEAVDHLDCDLGPLWDRALAAEIESLSLAELRELLLPKVMSGEIRVRDAEKVVEEAL
jgi:type I restriction enzyme S subunit